MAFSRNIGDWTIEVKPVLEVDDKAMGFAVDRNLGTMQVTYGKEKKYLQCGVASFQAHQKMVCSFSFKSTIESKNTKKIDKKIEIGFVQNVIIMKRDARYVDANGKSSNFRMTRPELVNPVLDCSSANIPWFGNCVKPFSDKERKVKCATGDSPYWKVPLTLGSGLKGLSEGYLSSVNMSLGFLTMVSAREDFGKARRNYPICYDVWQMSVHATLTRAGGIPLIAEHGFSVSCMGWRPWADTVKHTFDAPCANDVLVDTVENI